MQVIGVDLGGTKLAGAVFDEQGQILHKEVIQLEKRNGPAVGALIISTLDTLLQKSPEVTAIAVSVPGIAYADTGIVWAPNISGWEQYPLREEIKQLGSGTNISVTVDSDRACYILGEAWQGAAIGARDAIFLAVGTGIGAGIMINGEVLRGSHDIAGAVGWLALDRPFYSKYVSCGCFEYHASGDGIAKVAEEILQHDKLYHGALEKIKPEDITSHDVFTAYAASDAIAIKVIDQCIGFWGMTAANLVSIFNPEKIIFGGGVFGPALQFLERIMDEARKWAQPISIQQVRFEGSKLGGDAGLYGAGYLALQSLSRK
jgi:glucokinase